MVRVLRVYSVSEFVKFLETECSEHKNILFRGQRVDDPLEPRMARITPIYDDRLKAENRMFESFKKRSLPFLEMKPESDWDWLAVAQHYGLSTRLLDWSLNALASLWFAIYREPKEGEIGVLWVLKPEGRHYLGSGDESEADNPFGLRKTYIYSPKYVSKRIFAQRAYFTCHAYSKEKGQFIPLETDPDYADALIKIEIHPDIFYEMRYDLNRLGINALTIFPDLEGLTQEINWWYSYMGDEQEFDLNAPFPRRSHQLRQNDPDQ